MGDKTDPEGEQVALFARIPPLSTVELPCEIRPGVIVLAGLPGPKEAFPGACPQQLRMVHRGNHPMGHPLPGPAGETCGTCGHAYRNAMYSGKAFWKCDLVKPTGGYATDTRKSWPACARWAC